jgi:hypothetical protein
VRLRPLLPIVPLKKIAENIVSGKKAPATPSSMLFHLASMLIHTLVYDLASHHSFTLFISNSTP